MEERQDLISRQVAIDALDVLCQEHRYKIPGKRETYSQYNEAWQDALDRAEGAIFNLPTVQPDHTADVSKKVKRTDETAQNVSDSDLVSRKAAIEAIAKQMPRSYTPDGSHPADEEIFRAQEVFADCIEALEILPSAQPEILACGEGELNVPDTNVGDMISRQAAIDALNEYFARIGKLKRRGLTKGEKAISLDTVGAIKNLPPVEAIPVSWIEAKIELVNDLPGVSMLKMKAADWVDLVKQWMAEQRNPEVDHDAQIRELAEEMQKHGVHKPTAAPSTAQTTESTAPSTNDWIPVERELPEDLAEVNVTWVNHEPGPYYESIKSKPFTASAVYYKGKWYWYSSTCADLLGEYGRNDVDKVDDAIEITAWRPLPEPYRGGDTE